MTLEDFIKTDAICTVRPSLIARVMRETEGGISVQSDDALLGLLHAERASVLAALANNLEQFEAIAFMPTLLRGSIPTAMRVADTVADSNTLAELYWLWAETEADHDSALLWGAVAGMFQATHSLLQRAFVIGDQQ